MRESFWVYSSHWRQHLAIWPSPCSSVAPAYRMADGVCQAMGLLDRVGSLLLAVFVVFFYVVFFYTEVFGLA